MEKDTKEEKAFNTIMFRPTPIEQEPKRAYRFILEFPEEFKIESWVVQSLTRPKMTLVNGNYTWQNMEINFLDIVTESMPSKLYNISKFLKKENSFISLLKNKFGLKKDIGFTLTLKDTDPTGEIIGGFKIHIRNIASIDFGTNDYSSGDLSEIKLILQVQDCAVIQ